MQDFDYHTKTREQRTFIMNSINVWNLYSRVLSHNLHFQFFFCAKRHLPYPLYSFLFASIENVYINVKRLQNTQNNLTSKRLFLFHPKPAKGSIIFFISPQNFLILPFFANDITFYVTVFSVPFIVMRFGHVNILIERLLPSIPYTKKHSSIRNSVHFLLL